LEDEGTGPAADSSHDALEADERGRAVAAVHHQVLDPSLRLDVAGEILRDAGARQPRALPFTVGFLLPGLDGEASIGGLHPAPPSAPADRRPLRTNPTTKAATAPRGPNTNAAVIAASTDRSCMLEENQSIRK